MLISVFDCINFVSLTKFIVGKENDRASNDPTHNENNNRIML